MKCRWLNLFILSVALLLLSCSKGRENSPDSSSNKFRQYYVQGEKLYLKHCANCHQKDGTGLGLLYPPLNTSDYMSSNFDSVLCLIRYGKSGPLIVNGKSYNQPMPPIPELTNLEVAEIATYIYNSWEHSRGIIEVNEAAPVLLNCNQ